MPCPCSSCAVKHIYNIYDLAPNSSRETNVAQDTTDNDSDVASRPGRTLDKEVDENPTENPSQDSAEYHQNASVDDNVHEQSTEIEDELERSGKYRVIYGNGNEVNTLLTPALFFTCTDLTVSYDSHI